jgi:hypothetical protein
VECHGRGNKHDIKGGKEGAGEHDEKD